MGSADGAEKARASYCVNVCGTECEMPAGVKDEKAWHLNAMYEKKLQNDARLRNISPSNSQDLEDDLDDDDDDDES